MLLSRGDKDLGILFGFRGDVFGYMNKTYFSEIVGLVMYWNELTIIISVYFPVLLLLTQTLGVPFKA